jgi:uncharacterized protein (TIGR03067 family)
MSCFPILVLALAVGAPGVKDLPKKAEVPAIVGEWEAIEFVVGGRLLTPAELAGVNCGFEFTTNGKVKSRFGGETKDGTYTTGPGKDPAELDFLTGKAQAPKQAIYRLDEDRLTVCFVDGKGDRPTKFESPAGTRTLLVTFKRVEKKKE